MHRPQNMLHSRVWFLINGCFSPFEKHKGISVTYCSIFALRLMHYMHTMGLSHKEAKCVCVMTQGRPGLDGQSVLIVLAKISWEFAEQGGSHSIALQERENQQVQNEPKYDLMLFPPLSFSSLPSLPGSRPSHGRHIAWLPPFYFPPQHSLETIRLVKGGRDAVGYWWCCFGALIPFNIRFRKEAERDWWRQSQIPVSSWPPRVLLQSHSI